MYGEISDKEMQTRLINRVYNAGFMSRRFLVEDWPFAESNAIRVHTILDTLIDTGELIEIHVYVGDKYHPISLIFPKHVQFPQWSLAEIQKHAV